MTQKRAVKHRKWSAKIGAGFFAVLLSGLAFWLTGGQAVALAQVRHSNVIRYDDLPPNTGGAQDYVLSGAKWEHEPVTFTLQNCPRSLDCTLAWNAVRQAMHLWDVNCGISLVEIPSNGDIRVGWYTQGFDGPGNVVGRGYFPYSYWGDLAGDVQLDDSETWVVTPPTNPRQIDLLTAAVHEIGHGIGLDHSHDPNAIMYAEYSGVKTLGPDDIAACQALYGPPSPGEGSNPPPAPVGVTGTATVTVNIRSGPGEQFQVVGQVPQTASVPVIGRNASADWLYIDYNGLRGWAAGWLFTINGDLNGVPVVEQNGNGALPPSSPTPTPKQPVPPAAPSGVTGLASTTGRIRSGPGTNYAPIGSVPANTVVSILGKNVSGTWLFIESNGIRGWVAAWLFTITGDLNSVPVVQSQTLSVPLGSYTPGQMNNLLFKTGWAASWT